MTMDRISAELQVFTSSGPITITRTGVLTGIISEAGMLRVRWDEDGYGMWGWVEPGSYTPVEH